MKTKGRGRRAAGASAPFPIVGVGASAGGLEAFSELLGAMPRKPGLALVLVQHLSPVHESSLPELLARRTSLPVVQARDGMKVKVNCVYVVPPNRQITMKGMSLRVPVRPRDRSQYSPIDVFFRSLADNAGSRAIAVQLAGSASDGVAGLRDVRAAGGTTIVQEPSTTEFDSMPRAAISAGAADLVLAPAQIAATLVRLTREPLISPREVAASADLPANEHQLRRVFSLLRSATGVDFSHYKEPTIRRRLHRRMLLQKTGNLEGYIRLLEDDPGEVQNLHLDLLINVTRFFREPESFTALRKQVFPHLLEDRPKDAPVRIWVSGCSTGEEPYSIAISLMEFLADAKISVPIQIFATDVSDRAVERARVGIYPASIAEDVSGPRLRRFFTKVDGQYQVAKVVRDVCIFARQDLTRDPPFSKLDLIVCRNVLIYLDPRIHRKLMSVFHYALQPHGFLMLGRAESAGNYGDYFQVVDKKFKIFRRKAALTRLEVQHLPVEAAPAVAAVGKRQAVRARDGSGIMGEATRVLLSRYAPPGVVVDSDFRIVQTRGHTGAYLELAPGDPSLNLAKMLREGLLFGVRTALHEARKTNQPVRKTGLRVKSNGHTRSVDLEVLPLGGAVGNDRHYLVLFQQPGPESAAPEAEPKPATVPTTDDDTRVSALQQELAASREYLQSIIQDLEAANEELQSANEEILSSNEELQSSNEELDTAKEELQSTNEEINTVNEELQARNEELSRANSDLVNLLAGVQIAIVFLTSDLRIRRFTPMAEKVLNLIPTDIGRPIGNIRPNIECPDLEAIIQDSVDSVSPKEREVRDRDGRSFLLRVRPYKDVDNRIDGAVLVLLDIDALRRHERSVAAAKEFSEAIVETAREPLLVMDGALRVRVGNAAFWRLLGMRTSDGANKHLFELAGGALASAPIRDLLDKRLRKSKWIENVAATLLLPGVRKDVMLTAQLVPGTDARSSVIVLAVQER